MALNNSYSVAKSIDDYGILSIMYHRFDENKYPSTNIRLDEFKLHLDLIEKKKYKFISHKEFQMSIKEKNPQKKILLTIDDGVSSFYKNIKSSNELKKLGLKEIKLKKIPINNVYIYYR